MKWIEVTVFFEFENRAVAEDLIANAFGDVGIQGVVMATTDDPPGDGWAEELLPRPAVENRVTGYVADDDSAHRTCRKLEVAMANLSRTHGIETRFVYQKIDEEDWAESWKVFFKPERIGERVVVKPTWQPYSKQQGDIIIHLDPGMAFGTGTHPTTRLCVQLLEKYMNKGIRVLDVGAGSGILMAAAYKLGASKVWGVDIDPVAVEISRQNLDRNHVPETAYRVLSGDLARNVQKRFDLVAANILSEVILSLLDRIPALLEKEGIFICSGIIDENAPEVVEKMTSMGFHVLEIRRMADWTAIVGRYQPKRSTSADAGTS